MYEPIYSDLTNIMEQGFPQKMLSMASGSEYIWALQARKMAKMHSSGIVQKSVEAVKRCLPEWNGLKRMLDVGGSSGMYTVAFVSEHPTMTGVVFDRPQVVKVAAETIAEYGLSDRISVLGGNFTEGPLGTGYDFIWASDCLNFAWHELDKPISLIYNALDDGGIFISNHFHVAQDRTFPLHGVVFSAWHWLAGQEMYFYENQMSGEMLKAGFKSVQTVPYTSVLGFGQMDIARK